MYKRGQFYLVAAIIIIIAIFSIYTVRNFVTVEKEDRVVYDLEKELNLETGKVADWSIYNKNDTNQMIENWTELYVKLNQGKDIDNFVFAYGNSSVLNIISFNKESTGEVSIYIDNLPVTLTQTSPTEHKKTIGVSGTTPIKVTIKNTEGEFEDYEFNLGTEQNFIFLIKKQGYVSGGQDNG